ncbi:MAG: TetR/AcrR family transcriptional regulator [Ktedonobacteraceae bacterium]
MKKTIGEENSPPVEDRETRQHILKVARELFLSKGYKGVSMKEVAEEVQVTSAALYYHFPGGKQDLFFNIIKKMLDDWTQGAIHATAQSQGLKEELINLTQYLLTLPMDRFSILARDIHENVLDRDAQRVVLEQLQQVFVQHVADLFQEAIDAGEINQEIPAAVLATMYEGMSISLLRSQHFAIGGAERFDAAQLANFVVSVLLRGIADPGTS